MPFAPGQSGNPSGKPLGTRNKATQLAERLLSDDIEGVCQAVVEAAKAGDMTAARIIVDRLIPARRTRMIEIDLPSIATPKDIVAGHARVVEAMAAGEISPDEAEAIGGVLEAQRRAIETVELADRVAALEASAIK